MFFRTNDVDVEENAKKIRASDFRSFCPLIENNVFGITTNRHGVRLCSTRNRRTFRLHEHFRRFHHLKSSASLTIVRAMIKGDDPKIKRLFDENQQILNVEQFREVICPLENTFRHYPSLKIVNTPCYERHQLRHLCGHLQRVHKLTNRAASYVIKALKSNRPIATLEFPHWMNILQNESF